MLLRSHYLNDPLGNLSGVLRTAERVLRKTNTRFDVIVVSGVSGLLVGPALARAMRKRIAVVRKKGENSHSMYSVEGTLGGRFLILDDLISSGKTVNRIYENYIEAAYAAGEMCRFAGVYLYLTEEIRSQAIDQRHLDRHVRLNADLEEKIGKLVKARRNQNANM